MVLSPERVKMGRKRREATELKITLRGNRLWLRRFVNGKDCFFSSGYKNTPQNKAYLTKNAEAVFWQKYNEANDIAEAAVYSTSFLEYGAYALEVTDAKRTKQKQKKDIMAKFEALCSYFGSYEIQDITASMIELWQSKWTAGKWSPSEQMKPPAPKTIINYRSVMSLILKTAIKDGLIDKNPIELADAPRVGKRIANTYHLDDIEKILAASDAEYGDMIRFMVWTGMRPSEIIALRWSNVHLERDIIVVKEGMVEGELGKPKDGDERIAYILPQLKETVYRQMRRTAMRSEYVFLNQYSKPFVATKSIQTKFKKICEKAGVRIGEFYDLKRTFITLMKQNNQPIDWLMQQAGHNAATTTDIYTGAVKPDYTLISQIKVV